MVEENVLRSRWGAGLGILVLVAGTGAGAATLRRFAVTSATGSGGATTFLQSSASGSALQGEVASSALTSIHIPFGVLGEYNAAGTTFGAGSLGVSTTGYGVGAESLSAGQPSLIALNNSGGPGAQIYGENGGDALDIEGLGGGYGIYASSDSSNAVAAFSATQYYAAVYAEDEASAGGYGTAGNSFSTGGIGAFGASYDGGVGVLAEAESAQQGLPAIQAVTSTDGTELFDAGVSDSNTSNAFSVSTVLSSVSANRSTGVYTAGRASSDLQMNGDVYITGAIYTNCNGSVPYASAACQDSTLARVRSGSGADYDMYAAKHASETLEDEGEAVLRNGTAHVALDPAFASVISSRQPYLVFTTPQGDTRGLYVANRTPQGFDVRETSNGHNSLTFDYRIVGHPIGAETRRMAIAAPKSRETGGGRPRPSAALAQHEMLLKHIAERGANHKAFHMKKPPASLVSLR